jgi:hypothetical protein
MVGRTRYECRRALHLAHQARELVAYAKGLELEFARACEVRDSHAAARLSPFRTPRV